MKFESFALVAPLLRNLEAAGYVEATPIQQQAIPALLEGRDLIGCAQTGTGKTAAFTLPTLQRLMASISASSATNNEGKRGGRRPIRSLILTPTRELAGQISDSLRRYGKMSGVRHTVVYGGVGQRPQVQALQAGVDVLVATPGRLLDLISQGFIDLSAVEILILDEADQMLDMGFIHDLRRIVALVPKHRQTLMFSATMPTQIRELAQQWLRRPFEVNVAPVASTPERVSQSVCFVERQDKATALVRFLNTTDHTRTLVFSRTKHGADKITRWLLRDGIRAISIHGNKTQAKRQAAIKEFNSHEPPVLVATDLAARGLDFSGVSHVINYDMPDTPETYVHRIGRTARAGASGKAISFCGRDERNLLRSIERLTGKTVPVERLPGSELDSATPAQGPAKPGTRPASPARTGDGDAARGPQPNAHRRSRRNRNSQRQNSSGPPMPSTGRTPRKQRDFAASSV